MRTSRTRLFFRPTMMRSVAARKETAPDPCHTVRPDMVETVRTPSLLRSSCLVAFTKRTRTCGGLGAGVTDSGSVGCDGCFWGRTGVAGGGVDFCDGTGAGVGA